MATLFDLILYIENKLGYASTTKLTRVGFVNLGLTVWCVFLLMANLVTNPLKFNFVAVYLVRLREKVLDILDITLAS